MDKKPDFNMLTGRQPSFLKKLVLNNFEILIHPMIESDLLQWQKEAKLQGIDFAVASAYRSFERQLKIWNEKVDGIRPLRDKAGTILSVKQLTEQEILDFILLWSHIPGASRHHWGTDIDIFDASWFKKHHQQLDLNNSLYLENGPCAKLHQFNEHYFKTNESFYRPYNSDEYFMTELWHYSHKTISVFFEQAYSIDLFIKNLELAPNLKLKNLILQNAQYYFDRFVTLC